MDIRERKAHWEKVYASKPHREVSWFAEHIATSLDLMTSGTIGPFSTS